jgi:hypothetical protein
LIIYHWLLKTINYEYIIVSYLCFFLLCNWFFLNTLNSHEGYINRDAIKLLIGVGLFIISKNLPVIFWQRLGQTFNYSILLIFIILFLSALSGNEFIYTIIDLIKSSPRVVEFLFILTFSQILSQGNSNAIVLFFFIVSILLILLVGYLVLSIIVLWLSVSIIVIISSFKLRVKLSVFLFLPSILCLFSWLSPYRLIRLLNNITFHTETYGAITPPPPCRKYLLLL